MLTDNSYEQVVLSVKISESEGTHAIPDTSPPAGLQTASQSLRDSSSSTSLMTTRTTSQTLPLGMYVGPTQPLGPSAIRPAASATVPEATPPASIVPLNIPVASHSPESSQSPPHHGMSLSSTTDTERSSPGTADNLSLVSYHNTIIQLYVFYNSSEE